MAPSSGLASGQASSIDQSGVFTKIVSQPPKWLHGYADFITANASAVAQIESGLRSLTYIIPGRFRESEIATESLHSGIQLLSLYHDGLLAKAVARIPALQRAKVPTTPHHRYTKFWTRKSPLYRRLALLLQTIQYTELLWEMAAKRRGERVRWRVVVILEIVKAICRLLLLRLTNSRPLLSPPLPEREVDPSKVEEAMSTSTQDGSPADEHNTSPTRSERSGVTGSSSDEVKWTMPRTGLEMPTLPDPSDISSYLLSKVVTADDVKPPKQLLHRTSGRGELAEVLYILRPVFYAFAMQLWSRDRRDWRPWILGLGMEYGASQLAKQDLRSRMGGTLRALTKLEREELDKRGWNMAWWVMRGAFYENITRSWVQSFANKFRGRLLLDIISIVVDDYDFLWNQYYFSTATL